MSHIPFFDQVDIASDAINPIFVGLILEEPMLGTGTPRERWVRGLKFWGRVLFCLGIAVAMAELGKKYQIWHGHPNFPSGHTTFATSAAVCLIMQRGKAWAWLAIALTVVIGILLVYDQWHTPVEVLGGWILGTVVPYALWRLTQWNVARVLQKNSAPLL